jgi:HlyD family secretion protein
VTTSRWLLAGAGLLVLAVGAGWWWKRHAQGSVAYVTAAVTRGSVARMVTASGTVNPVLDVEVGSYVSGPITELRCDYNTVVKVGQLCAKIDPRPYETVVAEERANLANAEAQLTKDSAALSFATISYQRAVALQQKDYVSQDTVDLEHNVHDQAVAQMALDRASIDQHQAALHAAEVNLGYTNIVSPVDGTVISRNVTIGQTVAASFQTPTLFIIGTNLTQMQVDANVSESDIGGLAVGDKASFTVEAYPDRPFDGLVVQVRQAPQSVQNVVTYDVVIGVTNQQRLLMPGMTATCRIVVARRDSVVRVPDLALRYTPVGVATATQAGPSEHGRVWLLRDGKPVQVPVRLGLDDDTYSEVLANDLRPGDVVIVAERSSASSQARPNLPRL